MRCAAEISPCRRYRYVLTRRWGSGAAVVWVMLNPSTADETTDDPTVRRVIGYSRAWGYEAATVVNLYAYRAVRPRDLFAAADPVGPCNDAKLTLAVAGAARVIVAWGTHARSDRIAAVLALPGMPQLDALALTAAGQPRHPLYLPADLVPRPWRPVGVGPS